MEKTLHYVLAKLVKSSKQNIFNYKYLYPEDFGFLYPGPQKYADPRTRIQGVKYQPKTAKKEILLKKPKADFFFKREIIRISSFLNGSTSLRIKISEKIN